VEGLATLKRLVFLSVLPLVLSTSAISQSTQWKERQAAEANAEKDRQAAEEKRKAEEDKREAERQQQAAAQAIKDRETVAAAPPEGGKRNLSKVRTTSGYALWVTSG
jgi:ATP-dependent exoDNAse (exonuclease V) alpha subunit